MRTPHYRINHVASVWPVDIIVQYARWLDEVTTSASSVRMIRCERGADATTGLLTASRKHAPNFANSSLQVSLWTSVYVARMHLPYAEAVAEQVVVE